MRRRKEGKYNSLLYVYVTFPEKYTARRIITTCMRVFGVVVVDIAVKVVLLDDEGSTGCCCCFYVGCSHSMGTG